MTNDTVVLDYQEYTVSFVICHFRLNLNFYTHCWAQCFLSQKRSYEESVNILHNFLKSE